MERELTEDSSEPVVGNKLWSTEKVQGNQKSIMVFNTDW